MTTTQAHRRLKRAAQALDTAQMTMARELLAAHNAGQSVRQLADVTGWSKSRVHRMLVAAQLDAARDA